MAALTVLTSALQESLRRAVSCEIRFDDLTRQLYATDASIYQVVPLGVAFPRSASETADVIRAAGELGIPITPRGAGTGLTGGALGEGLVIDLARYNRRITGLDLDRRCVRVEAGVVLDQLNAFVRPHGLWFGPDVATSSRATLGGMIANNSSGAHVAVYGTTSDHVLSLEVVLADGMTAEVGRESAALPGIRRTADALAAGVAGALAERFPPGLLKRLPGYGFDKYLRSRGDLSQLVAGSEGTLAAVFAAELNLVPLPRRRGLALIFFASIAEAMQATVELRDLQPASIEHIDRLLFDPTRGQLAFGEARSLMRLDEEPCESILLVEFFDDVDDKLRVLEGRRLGMRKLLCTDAREQELVWALRRSGLTLLTACKGPAKPLSGIEDTCVPPERLPEYVAGLQSLLRPLGIEASFYGHAISGELHVRPKLNLRSAADVARFRTVAEGVSALVRQFRGSLAAEHGVGIARTEFMPDHLGPELLEACRRLKAAFDPRNRLNPGKIIPDGRYRFDRNLRAAPGSWIELPFAPVTGFVDRDESFTANLEQCNGCGGCRKDSPTMCPTYIVTGEEIMSTRGRANTIRAVLEGRLGSPQGARLLAPELDEALSNCLSCKACKSECPSNVDLAALKAELLHARHQRYGVPLVDRLVAHADLLGRVGTTLAPLSNVVLRNGVARRLLSALFGLAAARPLPAYTRQRFDRWFAGRSGGGVAGQDRVVLWDDTWVRYHEPEIGRAAVRVLEAAGFEVVLAEGRECCGRPACSRGLLDEARRLGEHNVRLLQTRYAGVPVVFLEPSCYSMFADEYRQFRIDGAAELAERCFLFEPFLLRRMDERPAALSLTKEPRRIAIHAHCHAKALAGPKAMVDLARRMPGAEVRLLDTACCGMAGAFGMLRSKYALSLRVAAPMVEQIRSLAPDTVLVASGTSCRHQITHLTEARPLHMAELLARALDASGG